MKDSLENFFVKSFLKVITLKRVRSLVLVREMLRCSESQLLLPRTWAQSTPSTHTVTHSRP